MTGAGHVDEVRRDRVLRSRAIDNEQHILVVDFAAGNDNATLGVLLAGVPENVACASTLVPEFDDAVARALVTVLPFLITPDSSTIGQSSGRRNRAVTETNSGPSGISRRI